MPTEILTILEMAVDGVALVICLASVALIFRSQRLYRRQLALRPMMPANFHTMMDSRRIGQVAENAFSSIITAVDAHRQQFMAAVEDAAPMHFSAARAAASEAQAAASPLDDWPPKDDPSHEPPVQHAPATMSLARKIQQRQQNRRIH
ncbi:MAG: hypothetical protein ABIL58_10255 [Pseudomonadota bacterium]